MRATPMGVFRKIMDDIWANSFPAADERPVLEWACYADEYTAGRLRIREHVLVDRHGHLHLAWAVPRRTTRERRQ